MAIRLFFSNQLEELSERLWTELFSKGPVLSECPLIFLPNANLGKWLRLEMANRFGVALNLSFDYLESGLCSLVRSCFPDYKDFKLLDKDVSRMLLCRLLVDEENGERFGLFHDYLYGEGAGGEYSARLWQICSKMAELYQEYEFHRPEMISLWQQEKLLLDSDELEQSQMVLWKAMYELRDELFGDSVLSLYEICNFIENKEALPSEALYPVSLFAISQVSSLHLKLLSLLKPWVDLDIYAMNPCCEYWEDVKTPGERRWMQRMGIKSIKLSETELEQGELFQSEIHPLLSRLGKPGRESVRLFCQLSDYDFEDCFREAEDNTLLKSLQNSLLYNEVQPGSVEQRDLSFQYFSAPSMLREVETVYWNILHNLTSDSELQLTDIAVMVPDMERYKPVIEQVFRRDPKPLPFNLVDSSAAVDSICGKGLQLFFSLVESGYHRSDLFKLLQNSVVMEKFGFHSEDVLKLARWVELTGAYHSINQEHKSRQGFEENDIFTWKRALKRLRLSRIMTGDTSFGFEGYFPVEGAELAPELVESFSLFLETVLFLGDKVSITKTNLSGWRYLIRDVVERLFLHDSLSGGEDQVLSGLDRSFEELIQIFSHEDELQVSFSFIRQFILSSLKKIYGGVGDYLTGGVTVSALQPMRPIPFKNIYILGLEEGGFPGREPESALDLRSRARKIGDVSIPERNRYLFLELLLSVRSKFYVSYVNQDLIKDRELEPGSVLLDLSATVESLLGQKFAPVVLPLNSYHSSLFLDELPNASYSDVERNFNYSDFLLLKEEPVVSEKKALESNTEEEDLHVMQIRDFASFIEDPLLFQVRNTLRCSSSQKGIREAIFEDDEPFRFAEGMDRFLLRNCLVKACSYSLMGEMVSPIDLLEDEYSRLYQSGQTPEAVFYSLEKKRLEAELKKRCSSLYELFPQLGSGSANGFVKLVNQSGNRPKIPGQYDGNAISLDPDCKKVLLMGELPLVMEHEGVWTVLCFESGKKPNAKEFPGRGAVRAFFHVLSHQLSKDELFSGKKVRVFEIYAETTKSWELIIDREQAEQYLVFLWQKLKHPDYYWLPLRSFTDYGTMIPFKGEEQSDEELLFSLKNCFMRSMLTDEVRLCGLRLPESPLEEYEKRVGVMLSMLRGGDS
jgi:exodeoxyribonuclease V gamma subunit